MFFSAVLLSLISSIFAQFLGPASITIQRIEKCAPDGPDVKVDLTIHKINRTHQGIDSYIDTPVDFNEDISINITASKWGDGGWKPHVLDVYEPYACMLFWKYKKEQMKTVLKDLGEPAQCPIRKRVYEMKNYIFDGDIGYPTMYGDFMIEMSLDSKGIQLTCIKAFVRNEPKKTGIPSSMMG